MIIIKSLFKPKMLRHSILRLSSQSTTTGHSSMKKKKDYFYSLHDSVVKLTLARIPNNWIWRYLICVNFDFWVLSDTFFFNIKQKPGSCLW